MATQVTSGGSLRIEKEVALAIIYENREKILLQLRDFKECISHPGEWALFGGSVKSKELPESALARELKEELDFTVKQLLHFRNYDYKVESARIYVYACRSTLVLERLNLKEGQDFGIFGIKEIFKGRLCSKKLQAEYPVADLALTIISDFFSCQ
ncbi:MAG: NUDIX domain-containing protein [Nitrospirae bacterium]|nr:NUDIX domain-containing protein [Nitrospirota bacterium]